MGNAAQRIREADVFFFSVALGWVWILDLGRTEASMRAISELIMKKYVSRNGSIRTQTSPGGSGPGVIRSTVLPRRTLGTTFSCNGASARVSGSL